jgi:hypothetical protein
VEKAHRVEVRSNVKAKLNHGPSAYGPPWQGCDPEGWVEPNKPVIGNCSEGEWKFIVPGNVTAPDGTPMQFYRWKIEASQPSYVYDSTLTVTVDRDYVFTAEYQPATQPTAKLTVTSSPVTGVPVTIDGAVAGSTPVEVVLTQGTHTVEVPQEVEAE